MRDELDFEACCGEDQQRYQYGDCLVLPWPWSVTQKTEKYSIQHLRNPKPKFSLDYEYFDFIYLFFMDVKGCVHNLYFVSPFV